MLCFFSPLVQLVPTLQRGNAYCVAPAARTIITLILLILSSTSIADPSKNVILQISENSIDKVDSALDAALALKAHYQTDILIVAYGAGIRPFHWTTPLPIAAKIKQARQLGIRIAICEKSMRQSQLRPSDMFEHISYVPAGVPEIIEKQYLGWAYLRL